MNLIIDGVARDFMPIQQFRARFGLPEVFGVALFEPKDSAGLGAMDSAPAQEALLAVRQRLVAAVPPAATVDTLLNHGERLAALFRQELEMANARIKLRPPEVEFAVAGFQDVTQNVIYHLIQLWHRQRQEGIVLASDFDFTAVYREWLNASARRSATAHAYQHDGRRFDCCPIYYPYGRLGLAVTVEAETYWLLDLSLACPAAGYMKHLCAQVSEGLCQALAK